MVRVVAALRALAERPTLLALSFASATAMAASLFAAAGVPQTAPARLVVVAAGWMVLAALIAYAFVPGFDLPWRATTRAPGRRALALTFDDGPHPESTPALLEALRAADVRATFFLVGERVARWPELARRIAADGHVVGNHTQRHRLLVFRTAAQIAEEVHACQCALAAVGVEARLFRPPHGFKPIGLHRALAPHRLRLVAWQGSIRDTDAPGAATVAARAIALARPGRILLLHDDPRCARDTQAAVALVVASCRALGYELVTL
jgi:peptidoglycan/xylan/chitin deacetylase (PgdA/CDA1 family)